jgi:hypothetical protein
VPEAQRERAVAPKTHDESEWHEGEGYAPFPFARRHDPKSRGFAAIGVLPVVGLVGIGVAIAPKLDAIAFRPLGSVPTSALAVGATLAGALVARGAKSPKTATALASLSAGLGAGMLGGAVARRWEVKVVRREAPSKREAPSALHVGLLERMLRWLAGPPKA